MILSDKVELPFQNVIDYTQFSIKWPSTKIGPELLDYLQSIPGDLIILSIPIIMSILLVLSNTEISFDQTK